ncbi:uncharacterized protein LOC119662586 [Teleopsis dalmanni]|uniref:uncharacterized protein LOC119662586 n=1 Tax=Teleopsis dalmanni TaxID=139649 RepID=UPI0018CF540F|nr:uncharacterized protein LOC119662586 [Teleopsis dalmanni]XP_037928161.1 uncharacterized protein LOC119662586 [Teleopsis dalmanni]
MVFIRNYLRHHINHALLQRNPDNMLNIIMCILITICICAVVYVVMFYNEICVSWEEMKIKRALMDAIAAEGEEKCPPAETHAQRMERERREIFKEILSEVAPTLAKNSDDESSAEETAVVTEERPTAVTRRSYIETTDTNENVTFQCIVDQAIVENQNKLYQYVTYQALTTTDTGKDEVIADPTTNNEVVVENENEFHQCIDNQAVTNTDTGNAEVIETVVENENELNQCVDDQAVTAIDTGSGEMIGEPATNNINNTASDSIENSYETCLEDSSKNSAFKTTSMEEIEELRREMEKVD